ncbi:hypothetical protein R69608_04231 [Paraburkholderia nemoris]|nr:hypothetical protein [Burkholderia sp. R-69608]CAE6923495.1 hypothetical protein R69608_04231 [Paraburkholderia nemoris]
MPENLLDELLPWLMLRRIFADDEVRRDLPPWVPECQTTMAPMLQSIQAPRTPGVSNGTERPQIGDV